MEKFVDSWEDSANNKSLSWEGSPSDLLQSLNNVARLYKIDTDTKSWPKAGNSLTRRLRPILSNLREGLGIHVTITRQTTEDSKKKKNTSIIRIRKLHPLFPLPPPVQNYAQNQNQDGGDTLQVGDNVSTQQLIAPSEYAINCAQETECGGSGHSGDTIATSKQSTEILHSGPLPSTYVAFDFEWSSSYPRQSFYVTCVGSKDNPNQQCIITSAAFVDNYGNSQVLHISDYFSNAYPERQLLVDINRESRLIAWKVVVVMIAILGLVVSSPGEQGQRKKRTW